MGGNDGFPDGRESPVLHGVESAAAGAWVRRLAEAQRATFYAETMGRPGLPPGIYFRLLLIGDFEGIDSERGIAWRAADSFALRDFRASVWKPRCLPPNDFAHASVDPSRTCVPLTRSAAVKSNMSSAKCPGLGWAVCRKPTNSAVV